MIYDSLILAAVTDELQRALVGGKVERVSQPTPLEVILRVFQAGAKHDLLLSCEPNEARAHLTTLRRDNPPVPPAFCGLLRKYLDGAWVVGVTTPLGFGERVLHVTFKATDGAAYTLIAEVMGKHSNLIFVNAAKMILGAAKQIGRDLSRVRPVQTGSLYQPPPLQRGRRDPFRASEPEDTAPMTADEAAEWLRASYSGVSPLLARESVLRAAHPLTARTLWYGLNEVLTVVRVGDYASRVWRDPAGAVQGAYPIPLLSVPDADQFAHKSLSEALDSAAASLEQRDAFSRTYDHLRTALQKARKAREKEALEIKRGIANAARADEYQQSGDLVMANQSAIAKGDTEASVADYYQLGPDGMPTPRIIALDSTLSLRENAERFYKKARKARDSKAQLEERLPAIEAEHAALLWAEEALATAKTAEEVAAVQEWISTQLARGLTAAQTLGGATDSKRQEPTFDGHKIRTFRSVDGWEILVGENATSNDYLTTKVASGSDIWLHVRAATSAHGVIRAQNRPASVSPAALQFAAEMVAARSEVKHSSLIPVDYTLKKYVRKPRKSAPGAVTYQNEKTLYVAGIHG